MTQGMASGVTESPLQMELVTLHNRLVWQAEGPLLSRGDVNRIQIPHTGRRAQGPI